MTAETENQTSFNKGKRNVKASIIMFLSFLVLSMASFILTVRNGFGDLIIYLLVIAGVLYLLSAIFYSWCGTFVCWRALLREHEGNENEEFSKARTRMGWSFGVLFFSVIVPLVPHIVSFFVCHSSVKEVRELKWKTDEEEEPEEAEEKSDKTTEVDDEYIPL